MIKAYVFKIKTTTNSSVFEGFFVLFLFHVFGDGPLHCVMLDIRELMSASVF